MTKMVLLAARSKEKRVFRSVIQEGGHEVVIVDSLSKAHSCLNDKIFQIAVIDEDFAGPSTGWKLAGSIQRCRTSNIKIIVLVRGDYNKYFESKKFKGKFNWVMGFPISPEQLLHELNRE